MEHFLSALAEVEPSAIREVFTEIPDVTWDDVGGLDEIKAAIAARHAAPGGVDWPQIAALYAALHDFEPSPVIMLNHAVAMTEAQWAEGQGAEVGIARIDALGAELEGYQPYHAARAEYLFRLDRVAESRAAYDRAIALAPSDADRAFLTRRRARLVENPAG